MSTNLLIFYRTNMAKIDTMLIMAIRVEDISNGVYKIRKIFDKESTYSKEIIEFRELD